MKCSTIQCENVNTEHAAIIIATNVQNGVLFHKHKPEMSSPFVSHLIDNCLLYARQHCTQTLLQ